MSGKKSTRYTEEFKKTIVNLHQNGKSYAEIEQEYGVSHSALAKWIKQYSVVRLDDDTLITAEQIKALQKRNAQLEEENLILKRHCDIHATLRQRLIAIHSLRHEHAVTTLCRVLQVNRSTYYKFRNRKDSRRDVENRRIRQKILAL